MNGALYISFFQGQLESALEQVVQLAVQEISKTVGATLNSMLLETAAKDQENQRLRVKLQSTEYECNKGHGKAGTCKGGRETNVASGETKPEQHTPSPSRERSMQADTLRIEQKGRAVGKVICTHFARDPSFRIQLRSVVLSRNPDVSATTDTSKIFVCVFGQMLLLKGT